MPAPIFDQPSYTVTVPENASIGDLLLEFSAVDPDANFSDISFSLTAGNTDGRYAIAGYLPTLPDYNSDELSVASPLDFEAAPSATLTLTATESPGGEQSTAQVNITVTDVDEAPVAGAPLAASLAEDVAVGTVVGSVSAADPEGAQLTYALTTQNVPFAVDPTTGEITTTAALDREQLASYALAFTASDGTTTPTAFNGSVTVTDVDEAPVAGAPLAASLAEDVAVGTVVGSVSAADPEGAQLTYALATQNVPFAVDPTTGEITTTAPLDRETAASYALALTASDGTNSAQLSAAVTVTDVDEAPVAGAPASFTVAENLPAGATVGTLAAADPEGASITYALTTQNVPFTVDTTTGEITTTAALDREQLASYALAFTASDGTTTPTAFNVAVNVTNVDEAPTTGAPATFSVAENLPAGATVGALAAADPEGAALTYALTTQNVPFAVDPTTGTVTTTAPLNFEQLASYTLDFTASDGANSTPLSASVTVTDANDAPTTGAPASFSVAENLAAGAAVGTLAAADPEGAAVTYALATQNVPFAVDPTTGEITTTAPLDREELASYSLAFTASDGANSTPLSASVTVTDVNEAPTNGGPASLSVGENLPVGSVVGSVSAADPENAALTYALTTLDVPFAVDPATGEVTTTAVLDREQLASYTLAFTASDGTTPATAFNVVVDVTNANEPPTTGAAPSFSLVENLAAGTVVGTISATDPEGAQLTYALATQNVPFAVDASTGVVTTTAPLDREAANSYALAFTASDGTNATPITASVDVTDVDEAPVVGGTTSFFFNENLPAGSTVGFIAASDPENAPVRYSLDAGGAPFRVNAVTGRITTTAPLDREQVANYTMAARATDGQNTTSFNISVGVGDVNETPTGAAGPFNVGENLAIGTVVGTVAAADPEGAQLTYALATQNVPFAVDASTGVVTTTAALDRETADSYALAFTASDGTNFQTLNVAVNVTNVDEAPVAVPVGPVTLAEDAPSGTVVATVAATDPEGTALTYALATQNVPFAVDADTGQVTTTGPVDFEARSSYNLSLTATDATGQETPISLAVSVTDVDEAPVPGATGPFNVTENQAAGAVVGTVTATNPENPTIGYTLVTAGVPFEINAATGRITTTATLDREQLASYTLEVEATDGETTTPISVVVNVGNVDEAPAAGAPVSASITETLPIGSPVGTVSAADPEGVALAYALTTQNVPFAVDASTGVITTTAALDAETVGSYNLALTAFDGANTVPLSASFTVTNVDEAPTAGPVPLFSVAENAAAGAAVGTVSATDPEGATVTYTLATADVPFAVDATTGAITTTAPLDRETAASYNLVVNATDATNNYTPISVPVAVTNVDEAPTTGAPASFSIAENLAAGEFVGTISATDPEGAQLTYALATPDVPFAVDAATGRVTTTAPLDREQLDFYSLAFTASDGSSAPTTVNAGVTVIDVNEPPANTGPTSFSVGENLAAGAFVGRVAATDPESVPVTYSLATENVPFQVNANTGRITTTEALDREQRGSYTLAVVATDGTTATTLDTSVEVGDENETPVNSTAGSFTAIEGQAAGTVVGTVSATDPEGAPVYYGFDEGSGGDAFAIDESTGVITTTAGFGYGDATSRTLDVYASDGTSADYFSVTVAIENVPDAPVFTAAVGSVREDAAAGTVLGRFSVANAGGAAIVFAGPSDAPYTVAEDGAVTLTAPLDYEAARSIAVSATAAFADASGPAARSPAGNGSVAVRDLYEDDGSGQAEPPAPFAIENGVASVEGTADGFKVLNGGLAYTDGNGATTEIPGVERAVFADGVLSFGTGTPEAFLQRLYLGLLGREADGRGISYLADAVEDGNVDFADIAQGFADSAEFIGSDNTAPSNREFVETLYTNFLGYAPDEGGAAYWTGLLDSGASRGVMAADFCASEQAQAKWAAETSQGVWVADLEDLEADSLYLAALGRKADPGARAVVSASLEAGVLSREDIAEGIVTSAEYAARHGSNTTDAVRQIFLDALGREADGGGLDAFTALYNAEGAAAVLIAITDSAEFDAAEEIRASGDYLFS